MKEQMLLSALCLASACYVATAQMTSSSNSTMPTATIANGTVMGTTTSLPAATAPVNKFLGIPFANPPQRFSPAEPADAFNGTFVAQTQGPACVQQFVYPVAVQNITEGIFNYPPPPSGESEDCLYLDIYAPSTPAPPDGRAVLFWIFGGGYQFGTGTLDAYDGSAFAAYQDVIVVTHNYRTNIFGFVASSDLPSTERNLGLLDQRMAMQWVQDNIAAFGGNASKVTIFGESAGGFSVDAHLTSFTTETAPFRAAIMESGQTSYQITNNTSTDNDAFVQQVVSRLNCTDNTINCLRTTPAATLKSIIEQNSIVFPPIIDNYTYFANRAVRRQAGLFAQVPILIGSNMDEGRVFEIGQTNLTGFIQENLGLYPDLIPAVTQAFPTNATFSAYDQISTITGLITFQCGSAYLANTTSARDIPTWRYLYNTYFPNNSPFNGLLRAYHSIEITSVFQTYAGGPVNALSPVNNTMLPLYLPATPQQYALGQYTNGAWASFAKDPELGPGWGKVGSFGGVDMGVLGGTAGTSAGVEMVMSSMIDAQCDVFRPAFEEASGVSLS